MFPYRQLRGAHNYCPDKIGMTQIARIITPMQHRFQQRRYRVRSFCLAEKYRDGRCSPIDRNRRDRRNGTGKSSLVHLAPAGRYVYSTWDNKIPQAPAGRHVCRIGWMHDKLVVEYENSTYRLPSNLGKIIA